MHKDVYFSIIFNRCKLEAIQLPFDKKMNKQWYTQIMKQSLQMVVEDPLVKRMIEHTLNLAESNKVWKQVYAMISMTTYFSLPGTALVCPCLVINLLFCFQKHLSIDNTLYGPVSFPWLAGGSNLILSHFSGKHPRRGDHK